MTKQSTRNNAYQSVRLRSPVAEKNILSAAIGRNIIKRIQRNPQSIGIIVLLFVSVIGLIVAGGQIASGVDGGQDWPAKIFWVTLIWWIAFLVSSYMYYRTAYLFSNAYLLALGLFHLGFVYMLALNQVDAPAWTEGPQSIWLELGGWYVFLALCSFGIGTALGVFSKKPEIIDEAVRAQFLSNTNRFLFMQGIGLGLAAIIFLMLALQAYGNILSYSRAEIFALTADSRGFGVFMMVMPGVVMLLALSAQSKKQKIFAYPFAAFVVMVIMLSGYRSAALFPLLVGVIIWVKSGRKIPAIVAVSGVIGILIAIAVIGVFRQMGAYDELGSEELQSSYEKASISDSFMEMGASLGVAAEVLKLVPETDPHIYGYSYWQSFMDMIPNLGLSTDTSESRGGRLAAATLDKSAISKMAPSDWLTYRLDRWKFDHGQGVGFSAVAEPYLNFGVVGVIVIFIGIGFVLTRFDQMDIIYHPYSYLFFAAIFWSFIRTVRNDFSNFTKPMGFIIIMLIIWNIGLHFLGKRVRF